MGNFYIGQQKTPETLCNRSVKIIAKTIVIKMYILSQL